MTRRRDERGAYAVMYGLMSVMLLGLAGLAVDIGNATARKSDVQGQADFGALSAARELGAAMTPGIKAAVLDAVADSMNQNQPLGGTCTGCVLVSDLDDGVLEDGEVAFFGDPEFNIEDGSAIRVYSPFDRVDFGFGNALGFSNVDVQGSALVDVFSPGTGVLPMYAVSGCDFGTQSITDPAGGQVEPTIPTTLAFAIDDNSTDLSHFIDVSTGLQTNQVTLNPGTPPVLRLFGSSFKKTTKIGFFLDEPLNTPYSIPNAVTNGVVTTLPFTAANGYIEFQVPAYVTSQEKVWYVRVFNDNGPSPAKDNQKWSGLDDGTLPLRVGASVLECAAGASDGNFGTLALPRTDTTPGEDLGVNISDYLQEPLTLAIHEQANITGMCVDGIDGAVSSFADDLQPGTNCVDTDTGLPAGAATDGLVTGTSAGGPGRLDVVEPDNQTNPMCGRPNQTMEIQNNDYTINNDTLTCFLDNGTTSLWDISLPTYTGPPALEPEVFLSPRFFWLPVLSLEPISGGSGYYSIVDFRPGFITDEVVAPTTIKGTNTATADNGLYTDNSGNNIIQIKVIFFDVDALPADTPGPVTHYLGIGPKLIRLID